MKNATKHTGEANWLKRIDTRAFTLIELLVVISIMALLAAFIFPVLGAVKKSQYINVAKAEMEQIEASLDNYKGQYGTYPPANPQNAQLNPLYYELVGVLLTNNPSGAGVYEALDYSSSVLTNAYPSTFNVGGVINYTKPGADTESVKARSFLSSLKQNRIGTVNGVNVLVTSAAGPDVNYMPLGVQNVNPFRYAYPGTNNPASYDLWVQLQYKGKTYLICNWSKQVIVNSPLP